MAFRKIFTRSSGVYDVTGLLGLSSGAALLEVRDGIVWIDFLGATLSGSGNVDLTSSGLAPVAPQSPRSSHNLPITAGAGTPRRLQINEYGYARVFSYAAGEVLNGTVSWPMTRPMPTTMPGVKL